MKIDMQNPINYHIASIDSKKQTAHAETPAKTSRNFDAITISSEVETSQEQMFASSLTSRLSLELRKPANTGMVEDLQRQIEQGTYQVDVNVIADRILAN